MTLQNYQELKTHKRLFIEDLNSRSSQNTVKNYSIHLDVLIKYLNGALPTKKSFHNFVKSELQERRGVKNKTIIHYTKTFREFCKYLNGKEVEIEDFAVLKHQLPIEHIKRETFTIEEYRKLLARVDGIGYWPYAIITAWNTGLRLSDISMMKWSSIDLKNRLITVQLKKTKRFNKVVDIPITDELFALLNVLPKDGEYVSAKMVRDYDINERWGISCDFSKFLRELGIQNKSFHCFRHTFVTRLLESGVTAEIVSSITGQSLQQVMGYCHISMDKKRQALCNAL